MALTYVMNDWTAHDIRTWIDYTVSIGYEYIEIQMLCLPDHEQGQNEIVEYALSKGLKVNLHSHYKTNNITDTDEENRKKSIGQLKQTIDLAARYHLGPVTFHPGRLSSDHEDPEEKWRLLLKTVEHVAEYAKEKKVRIGLENMEKRRYELVFTMDDLNRFAYIGENNPYFGVTVDFAHFASHEIYSPKLEELKLPVFNVHISQYANGKMHAPLTAQNGAVDVRETCRVLKKYGYDSFAVLEIHEDFLESIQIMEEAWNS